MNDGLKRLAEILHSKLYVFEDEDNPNSSKVKNVLPIAVIDDIYEDETASRSLREILDDLRQEILTGGIGNIKFPVTSVNKKTGDVVLTKVDIGLGRVDNTADIDKPLSTPQREAIMNILEDYDFHINLQDVYDHITNMNNPHGVTIEQLNFDGMLEEFVKRLIALHNNSREHTVHLDIRRSLATLWELVEKINNEIDGKLDDSISYMNEHYTDPLAHEDLFNAKENKSNKVASFTDTTSSDHTKYPSTRAVVEYVIQKLIEYNEQHPDIENWIDDISVVDTRDDLPTPTLRYFRKAFFIRKGIDSHCEIAICRKNSDQSTYSWDCSSLGSYHKFDEKYFMDSTNGLTLEMSAIVNEILSNDGTLKKVLEEVFDGYYNKKDIDDMHLVSGITIIPGDELGCIKYYINDNQDTISDNIPVNGLKRIAYLEWITEKEIWDNAIRSNHIINKAIETRHIQDMAVTPEKMYCHHGYLLGNLKNPNDDMAHFVTLTELADVIRPLIGGWPDPSTPGGNPYYDAIQDSIVHPHMYTEGIEYDLGDHSYIQRFKGTISVRANEKTHTCISSIITSKDNAILDSGGSWIYQSDPLEMTTLGGSNITGHTFAMITLTESGIYLDTVSIGERRDAPFDVWIRYTKKSEDGTYEHR